MSERKVVLVTGVGGNVGQGIVRSIRANWPEIMIIGTNTVRVSAGNHLCDVVHQVPFSTSPEYSSVIADISKRHSVDLVIPSTDYETYHLALLTQSLPAVAVSPARTCQIFLDKWLTWEALSAAKVPFAPSILPSRYHSEFEHVVVKPREGRGSRDVVFQPENPAAFGDDFVVQRRYFGPEITTAFYVCGDGSLHGQITLRRSLTAGMTSACEVTFDHDSEVTEIIHKLMQALPIRGACNVQSIVSSEGIVPFEINCRLSGTNSIRGCFGFEDVRYTVEEYLFKLVPTKPNVQPGAALRISMDVIFPGISLEEIQDRHTKHFIF